MINGFSQLFSAFVLPMPLGGGSSKLLYFIEDMEWSRVSPCEVSRLVQNDSLIVSCFRIRVYCNHVKRIDSSIKPRHLIQMIVQ